jgi:drug/metabolite transporter (DMT)-like permease
MGSLILLIGLLIGGYDVVPTFNVKNISILVYLGLIVTGIGYWAYFKGIAKGGAIMGSLAFFIKPVLTPFATFFINGIKPEGNVILSLVLVVIGSVMCSRNKSK